MGELHILIATFKLHLGQSWSRATFKFCILVQPLLYTFILYFMYRDSGLEHYLNYVILGSGITSLWSSLCFSSAGDMERERYMGTLENLVAAPARFSSILWGKIMANTFLGLSGMGLSLVFIRGFFGSHLYIENPGWFAISFFMMIFAFMCIAILIAPIFTLSKNARALMNCLEYPIFILCGMVFPIDLLPVWIRPISWLLSPTWAVSLVRQASMGIPNMNQFTKEMLWVMMLSLVYLALSKQLLKQIDKRTRILATLGVS